MTDGIDAHIDSPPVGSGLHGGPRVLLGGFLNGSAESWGVFADDPAVVLLAVEYVRHDIAMHILVDRVGPDRVRQFWGSDPELARLRADRGSPAEALRTGARAAQRRSRKSASG